MSERCNRLCLLPHNVERKFFRNVWNLSFLLFSKSSRFQLRLNIARLEQMFSEHIDFHHKVVMFMISDKATASSSGECFILPTSLCCKWMRVICRVIWCKLARSQISSYKLLMICQPELCCLAETSEPGLKRFQCFQSKAGEMEAISHYHLRPVCGWALL